MTKHLAPATYIFPRSARLCHGFLRRVRSTRSYGRADFAASGCCCWGCWYCYCCYYCSGPGRAYFVVLASWAPIYRHCRKARAAHKVKSRRASGSFMGLLTNSLNRYIPPRSRKLHHVRRTVLGPGRTEDEFSSRKTFISRSLIAEYEAVWPTSLFQK